MDLGPLPSSGKRTKHIVHFSKDCSSFHSGQTPSNEEIPASNEGISYPKVKIPPSKVNVLDLEVEIPDREIDMVVLVDEIPAPEDLVSSPTTVTYTIDVGITETYTR